MSTLSEVNQRYEAVAARRAYLHWALARAFAPTSMDALADFERRVGSRHPNFEAVQKTVVSPTEYSDDFRGGLRPIADRFAEFLRPATALGKFGTAVRRVPPNTPILAQASSSSAVWAGQAKPISVSAALDLAPITMPELKLGLIAIVTQESAKGTDNGSITIVEKDLTASVAEGQDSVFLGANAAVSGVSPAGLLNGVTPIGSASPADLEDDVAAALLALRNGQPASPFVVVSAAGALALATARDSTGARIFPDVGLNGGTVFGVPVVVSAGAGSNLIAIDASALLVVDSGVELSGATHASVQLDSAPDDPPTASTVSISLWERDLLGIRVVRYLNWRLAVSDAVAYVALEL